MTDLRTAAQQALWALEGWDNYGKWVWPKSALEQAKRNTTESLAALRDALAEPVQEPVAELVALELERIAQDPPVSGNLLAQVFTGTVTAANVREFGLAGGAAAPPQRKPLTDDEIHDCFQQRHKDKATERRMITRAIERAHGIE